MKSICMRDKMVVDTDHTTGAGICTIQGEANIKGFHILSILYQKFSRNIYLKFPLTKCIFCGKYIPNYYFYVI